MSRKKENYLNQEEDDDDDENDDDYVPIGANDSDDAEPSADESEEEVSEKAAKRKKASDGGLENSKKTKEEDKEEPDEVKKELEKKKADELWSNFLKDVRPNKSNEINSASTKTEATSSNSSKINLTTSETSKSTPKEDIFKKYESASARIDSNQEVKIDTKVSNEPQKKQKSGGLSSILDRINKDPKISTLQKSRLDWDEFKKKEQIEDDMKTHSNNKNSYLERQAFLQRTDLRQFEIEKELRNKERKLRENK